MRPKIQLYIWFYRAILIYALSLPLLTPPHKHVCGGLSFVQREQTQFTEA